MDRVEDDILNFWGDGFEVLARKSGDVTGDGVPDQVVLIGRRPYGPESPYVENIILGVENGTTHERIWATPEYNAGYNARFFLGNFTGDRVADILMAIDSGGSGGYGFYYIYRVQNNSLRMLFDFDQFNRQSDYEASYADDYRVNVVDRKSGMMYIIDISRRDPEYLNQLYNPDGTLKEPVVGGVLGMSGAAPVAFRSYDAFDLLALQRIIGIYNADTLGYVQTVLRWNGTEFEPDVVWVAVGGEQRN